MKLIKLRHPYLSLAVMLLTNFLIGCSVVEKAKNGPDDLTSKVILFDGSGLANWVHTDFAGKGNIFINEKKHLVIDRIFHLTSQVHVEVSFAHSLSSFNL